MNNNISSYDYRTKLFDSYDKFIPIGNGRIGASVWMTMTEKLILIFFYLQLILLWLGRILRHANPVFLFHQMSLTVNSKLILIWKKLF